MLQWQNILVFIKSVESYARSSSILSPGMGILLKTLFLDYIMYTGIFLEWIINHEVAIN